MWSFCRPGVEAAKAPSVNSVAIRADINKCECAKRTLSVSGVGIGIGIAVAIGIRADYGRDCDPDTDSDPDCLPIKEPQPTPWVRPAHSRMLPIRIYLWPRV